MQSESVQPLTHAHFAFPAADVQMPPFLHGLVGAQGSLIWQVLPVVPALHAQENPPPDAVQVPANTERCVGHRRCMWAEPDQRRRMGSCAASARGSHPPLTASAASTRPLH